MENLSKMNNEKNMAINLTNIINIPHDLGIVLGHKNAHHRLIAFLNLSCPGSKAWFESNDALISKAVKKEKLSVQYLLWSKPKLELTNGNVVHHFIDYNNAKLLDVIRRIFYYQDDLKRQQNEGQVIQFIKQKFLLTRQNNQRIIDQIGYIAMEGYVKIVPTIILDQTVYIGSKKFNQDHLQAILAE